MAQSLKAKAKLRFYLMHLFPGIVLLIIAFRFMDVYVRIMAVAYVLYWLVWVSMHLYNRRLGHWQDTNE